MFYPIDKGDKETFAQLAECRVRVIRYLDHGFYQVSRETARRLCNAPLPRPGRERLVQIGGSGYWVSQTPHRSSTVWSVRLA